LKKKIDKNRSNENRHVVRRHMYTKLQSPENQIVSRGDAAFLVEASKRGWSVFHPLTPDVGIDYIIAKGHCAAMVQFKTATLMDDGRYHVTVGRFLEGSVGYVIYLFQDINAFFLVPTVDFWEIPRFKALKPRVFEDGPYPDKMSYEKAKEIMGDYQGEKGWQRLEDLTAPKGLLKAIKGFIDRQKTADS